ncbi:MAG: FlgD immunoglobulin-like domain containing protein, partial [Candidatus Marinimicrobia bacterium]|nr:FlgD immunoglobulin-like domain containing protein [Candidatus Neomarinimicrobiota bacterium]
TTAYTVSGVTSKSTSDMQTESTYTDVGWDFTNIWAISNSYPTLIATTLAPNTITFNDGSSYSTSVTQGNTDQVIGRFSLNADGSGSYLERVTILLNGTRTGASNFKLWKSSNSSFESGTDSQYGLTISADPGTGELASFSDGNVSIGTGTEYYFLTCDVASDATGSIDARMVDNSSLTFYDGLISSDLSNEVLSDGDSSLPVELIIFTATRSNDQVTLRWITGSETENLGFNVYRSRTKSGNYQKNNKNIIKGAGNSSTRHNYEFIDKDIINGVTFWYKLEDVDYSGNTKFHGPISPTPLESTTPKAFRLYPNYPNPFNPVTTIQYDLPEDGYVQLVIYNIRGEVATTLVKNNQTAGSYQLHWNGKNENGKLLPSGIYLLKIVTGNYTKTNKMVLMR